MLSLPNKAEQSAFKFRNLSQQIGKAGDMSELETHHCTQWRMQKIFMGGGFQSANIFLCTKIESMIRKNIKQAAIQYVNVVKQL